jgi:nucleoside-diphosphate-sugar epimerase
MKILVTGTAGFIGFHLAQALLARGDEVVGLDSINDYYDQRVKYGRLQAAGGCRRWLVRCTRWRVWMELWRGV